MPDVDDRSTIDEQVDGRGTADGRSARRDRNREAVLDAVLALFSEGSVAPVAREVAERSGVSLRSVHRYFDDMDELVRAAIARNVERARPLFVVDGLGEGPLDGRIRRLVDGRLTLYDAMAPTMRAALQSARGNERIRAQVGLTRDRLLAQVEQMFRPELRTLPPGPRGETLAALDVLLGFESLEHLRAHRDLERTTTRRLLERSVRALLEPPAHPERGAR